MTSNTTPELLPCPFCGAPDNCIFPAKGEKPTNCDCCGASGPADSELTASQKDEAWNHRPDSKPESQWISVSDRLPPHGQDEAELVLVYIQDYPQGYCETAMMYPDGKWSHGAANKCVNYWQPLPPPPESKPHKNYVSDMVKGPIVYEQGRVFTDEEVTAVAKYLESVDGIHETMETGLGLSQPGSAEAKQWEEIRIQAAVKAERGRVLVEVLDVIEQVIVDANEDCLQTTAHYMNLLNKWLEG